MHRTSQTRLLQRQVPRASVQVLKVHRKRDLRTHRLRDPAAESRRVRDLEDSYSVMRATVAEQCTRTAEISQ